MKADEAIEIYAREADMQSEVVKRDISQHSA
jgi:hypothetical protein